LARKRRGPISLAIATIAILPIPCRFLLAPPKKTVASVGRARCGGTEPARRRSVSETPAGGDNVRSDVPTRKAGALGDGAGRWRRPGGEMPGGGRAIRCRPLRGGGRHWWALSAPPSRELHRGRAPGFGGLAGLRIKWLPKGSRHDHARRYRTRYPDPRQPRA